VERDELSAGCCPSSSINLFSIGCGLEIHVKAKKIFCLEDATGLLQCFYEIEVKEVRLRRKLFKTKKSICATPRFYFR
jgi:hypothetical protein